LIVAVALSPAAILLGRLGEFDPFLSNPQPYFLVERANRLSRLLTAFLSLLAEPVCIVIGISSSLCVRYA
jgi:hypothetical protein